LPAQPIGPGILPAILPIPDIILPAVVERPLLFIKLPAKSAPADIPAFNKP